MNRAVILHTILALSSGICLAQASPARDPRALSVITQALAAMRVQAPITMVVLTGTVAAAPESQDPGGSFTSTVEVGANGYEVRNEFESNGVRSIFVSGHGTPRFSIGSRVRKMSAHVTMITAPSQLPILELINALNNQKYKVTEGPTIQIGGVPALAIHISNEADSVTRSVTPQDWYFDPTTGLPLRWQFLIPDTLNAGHSVWKGTKDFANYQIMDGVLLPSQIIYSRDDKPASITTISSVQFNVSVPDSAFDLSQGAN